MAFTVSEIAQALGARAVGDVSLALDGPSQPETAGKNDLALAMDPKFASKINAGKAQVAILWDDANWQDLGLSAAIFTPKPRFALSGINKLFEKTPNIARGIHPSAVIDKTAIIGKNPSIGAFVSIEKDVVIGDNARIMPHCSIAEAAQIGAECLLFHGVRIGARVQIGERFIAQPNSVIGGDGFSFVSPERTAVDAAREGQQPDEAAAQRAGYARTNSLGAVQIGDDVELGAGATIDRGTIVDTKVGDGTKIDNLVMIGHNAVVGRHCLLCAQTGIGGSSVVGDHVVLGGQVGVADHVVIGNNVVAAGKSGISSNVPPNRFIMGNPAIKMEANVESYKAYRRLPKLVAKVENLQKQVSKMTSKD